MKHILTPEEQSGCYMLGALLKGAELCLPPRVLAEALAEKQGAAVGVSPGGLAKTVVTISVLTGLPLGIASHLVGKKIESRSKKERELELRRNYYTEATRSLEQGLPPVQEV